MIGKCNTDAIEGIELGTLFYLFIYFKWGWFLMATMLITYPVGLIIVGS